MFTEENNYQNAFKTLKKAPGLGRTNGMGSGLYGWLRDSRLSKGYIKVHFVSILWIPVLPLAGYVVDGVYNEYRFYRKISLWNLARIYLFRIISLYLTALVEGAGLIVLFGAGIGLVWAAMHLFQEYVRG
ncbi:MAG: hypothetical protein ACKOPE_02370 [Novosphingobium sp.]